MQSPQICSLPNILNEIKMINWKLTEIRLKSVETLIWIRLHLQSLNYSGLNLSFLVRALLAPGIIYFDRI
jgi:hypothetical protein